MSQVDDYNLLRTVTVISYTTGYVHGIMATGIASGQKEKEEMNSSCQAAVEDVPIEKAKILIKQFFEEHHGENLDYGDIQEALCISLPTIVEACDQLEEEGKIAGVD